MTRTVGPDQQTGTITFHADTSTGVRVDYGLTSGVIAEIYQLNGSQAQWIDTSNKTHAVSGHNLWSEPVWFFPALSLLSHSTDQYLVFTDLGPQTLQNGSVEHIQVHRTATGLTPQELQELVQLSTVDYYLDSQTALPVAFSFTTHPDKDLTVNLPVMAVFSGYQSINGFQVPFQIMKVFNGTPLLTISITNAIPNE